MNKERKDKLYQNITPEKVDEMSTSEKEKFLQHFVVGERTLSYSYFGEESLEKVEALLDDHKLAEKMFLQLYTNVQLQIYSRFFVFNETPKIVKINFVYNKDIHPRYDTTYYVLQNNPLEDIQQISFPNFTLFSFHNFFGGEVWASKHIKGTLTTSLIYLLYPYLDKSKIELSKEDFNFDHDDFVNAIKQPPPIYGDSTKVMYDGTKFTTTSTKELPLTIIRGGKVWHLENQAIWLLLYIDKSKIRTQKEQ